MLRCRFPLSLAAIVFVAACADNPVGPTAAPARPTIPAAADPSIITPLLLPPDADWGHYFVSFNSDRQLAANVIHYPSERATGHGTFVIPGFGTGALQVAGAYADPTNGYLPNGSATGTVPEGSHSWGIAVLAGPIPRYLPYTLDLHSNFWPNPQNVYDTATLTFTNCGAASCTFTFFGELHHEPQ